MVRLYHKTFQNSISVSTDPGLKQYFQMITAIILTKNEEKNITRCLKSLNFYNEIIVIDDYSSDQTVKIAKKLDAKIYKRKLNGDFAAQRNFGLEKAKNEWVLFIDADEIIPPELRSELSNTKFRAAVKAFGDARQLSTCCGYYTKRSDFFMGKKLKHGETGNIKLLRLAKKNSGEWKRKVHEVWEIEGEVGELKNEIAHHPHLTLRAFIKSINKFSTIHSKENFKEGKRSNVVKIITYPIGKFLQNYLFKLGFLDGTHGFVHAILMSSHSFFGWVKLWIFQKNKKYSQK